jgi:MFS family permease
MTDRYVRLLRVPHVAPLLWTALIARLPIGIEGLAVILFLRAETGSYAIAGAVGGALAFGSAIGVPTQSRLIDRLGQRRVLVPASLVHATGVAALIPLGYSGAPAPVLIAVALVTGFSLPPMSSVLRSLWSVVLHRDLDLRPTAYAVDSIMIELVFIGGPLLVAVMVAVASPSAALAVAATAAVTGTLLFTSLEPSRAWEGSSEHRDGGMLGALRSPGVVTIALTMFPVGAALGAIEVSIPAFTEDTRGTTQLAGVLLAVWSIGSAVGGFIYGSRERSGLRRFFLRLSFIVPLALLPLALAPSFMAMVPLLVIAGTALAPLLAAGNQMIGDLAPPGRLTEAYAWPQTALIGGIAAGSALSGTLVEAADWRVAMLVGALAGVVGAAVAFTRRGTLCAPQAAAPLAA